MIKYDGGGLPDLSSGGDNYHFDRD
jgi:hypothetical protein